jgi:hypothetical protein
MTQHRLLKLTWAILHDQSSVRRRASSRLLPVLGQNALGDGQTDRLLGKIHPNPERSGCPGLWFVFAAAIRRLPAEHPVFSHLTECSPCYREYRGIQQTESFVWTWQFRLSRAARGISVLLLRRLRRATRYTPTVSSISHA